MLEYTETAISGSEVPIDTMVSPIMNSETPMILESLDAPSVNQLLEYDRKMAAVRIIASSVSMSDRLV